MKKLSIALLALALIAGCASCSAENTDGNDLASLIIDETLTDNVTIGDETFYFESVDVETVKITSHTSTNDQPHTVVIPATISYYKNAVAEEEGELTTVKVTVIGKEAFAKESRIQVVDFSQATNLTTIEDSAFRECKSLESVEIPATVTYVGVNAFYGCSALKTVTLSWGMTEICPQTFMNCTSLETIQVPGSAKEIGSAAFFGCTSLTSVNLEEGVEVVNNQAFQNCTKLATLYLPQSLKSLDGDFIFTGTEEKATYYYDGANEDVIASLATYTNLKKA